jgi:hypothetical protein
MEVGLKGQAAGALGPGLESARRPRPPRAAFHGEVVGRCMVAHCRATPIISGEGEIVSRVHDMMKLLRVETK